MPLFCPHCAQEVRGDQVDVAADLATCAACGEQFAVSASLNPTADDPGESVSPSGALQVDPLPNGGVSIMIPAAGAKSSLTRGLIFFAVFWNGISWILWGGFMYAGAQDGMPWFVVCFVSIFPLIGVFLVWWACKLIWEVIWIELSSDGFLIHRRLFRRDRVKTLDLADVESFRLESAYQVNNQPVLACFVISNGRRKLPFGHSQAEADKEWLAASLNQQLLRLKANLADQA